MVHNQEELQNVLNKGGPLLGMLVTWDIEDARTPRSRLESIFSRWNFDRKYLPEDPTDTKALRQAVVAASAGRGKDTGLKERADLGKDDEDEMVWSLQIQALRDGQSGDVVWKQTTKVHLFKHASALKVDRSVPFAKDIEELWLNFKDTHSTDEVRRMLTRMLDDLDGFRLRKHGGAYFIHSGHVAKLMDIRAAVREMGKDNVFRCLSVHESPIDELNNDVREGAEEALAADLDAFREEVQKFAKEPPRVDTLANRIEQFEELRKKGEVFKAVLGVQISGLDEALDALTAKVESLIPRAK